MTISLFEAYERTLPGLLAEASMRAAESALYPHASERGQRQLWQGWTHAARSASSTTHGGAVPASGFTFNGRPVDFATLRQQLGAALGGGLAA